MTTNNETQCVIWPEYLATEHEISFGNRPALYVSPRTGGGYTIRRDAERRLRYIENSAEVQRLRARLTTWLVEMRQRGEEWPLVTTDTIEQVRVGRDLHPYERADRLLRYFAEIPYGLGTSWRLDESEIIEVMVQCECIDQSEVDFLVDFLVDQGWLKPLGMMNFIGGTVTLQGYARIADMQHSVDSSQAFVAMWFDPSLADLYSSGIEPAVRAAGYKPLRIDQKPDANKIDDEIIAEIRRSRFVVADCTHGDDGARGGVYYEAGFAYGLNIPVIFTCRQDMFDKIHFDTRQYNHIGWAEPEDLVEPLKNRILARIGEGPGRR